MSFSKVLIANRGAIACRIIRTLKRMGLGSVAVYSDSDAASLHVRQADEAICIGAGPAAQSYLNSAAILDAARATGAGAIHPGYGFLSENADFAEACAEAGLVFVGPTPTNMRAFALKHAARQLAEMHGVPLTRGSGLLRDEAAAIDAAGAIGYPLMLKATAGGGGIGMRIVENEAALRAHFSAVARLAQNAFADSGMFLERYIRRARHIEVQIFGNGAGDVVALGERDCSLQRRNQKVIEETPAPNLPARTRAAMVRAALRLGRAAQYQSAGTVEFLYDVERDEFFFLEVNARLQVEHGVTEEVTGVDLVEWMLRGASGDYSFMRTPEPKGVSIQARLYAEDPAEDFRPRSGTIIAAGFPADARVETWVEAGAEISAHYDSMLAKLIVHAPDRNTAAVALKRALDQTRIAGIETNLDWLRAAAAGEDFLSGAITTASAAAIVAPARGLRIISGGPASSVQDYPGRLGFWDVGAPPSGPMDSLSFRIGNALLANAQSAPGIEFAGMGPTLQFLEPTRFCLTGATFDAALDGIAIEPHTIVEARAGQTLKIGRVTGAGLRGYLLIENGFDIPAYLGSAACFTLGGFGGHAGRALAAGDVLRIANPQSKTVAAEKLDVPHLTRDWRLRVLAGPHGAPDFFTPGDIDSILSAAWKVHYNSSRTGVRLIGPKPQWARRDGGEAGLHPSNIHDNAYAIGAVDFTGDMPIILGRDGPSLGGFVCPFVVASPDLWKLGQLAPGDSVRFELAENFDGAAAPTPKRPHRDPRDPVLHEIAAAGARPRVIYRRQGDSNILVEYGDIVLDLELRARVHALFLGLRRLSLPGIIDVTPGVRSLQVHIDPARLSQARLLDALIAAEDYLGALEDFEAPSRIVHLPLSWDDPAIHETIEKYQRSVRDDAPWTPSNIEFIRRINGLDTVEDVKHIIFDASYLVMGLGDVYLGAPVATPLDPSHRLVTTKYNPARTWTPPNVVGIGGAYMCIYGMEGPGGYQLFGRTIQVWNTYRQSGAFEPGKPWLLRFFDQIRFFPVSHEELRDWRRDFPAGLRDIKIEPTTFRLSYYRAFLAEHAGSITDFQRRRETAFAEERARWEQSGEFARVEALSAETEIAAPSAELDANWDVVESPLGGSVWRILVQEGARVEAGAVVAVIEAMKAECDVACPSAGIVRRILAKERQAVAPGTALIAVEPEAAS